jgi:hypothetical protein
MARVFFISTVNGRSKKKEKKPILRCASSGHNKQTWAIFFCAFDIYGKHPLLFLFIFSSFEREKKLLIMGPNNTKKLIKKCNFLIFNYE